MDKSLIKLIGSEFNEVILDVLGMPSITRKTENLKIKIEGDNLGENGGMLWVVIYERNYGIYNDNDFRETSRTNAKYIASLS